MGLNLTFVRSALLLVKYTKEINMTHEKRTCFIVSPIGNNDSEIRKNADKVLKHIIVPVCNICNLEPIRVDQINNTDVITQTIIDKLREADLVIADITGHNPNVFYEIGYRVCTNKPIIYLKNISEKIPFDITTIRTFEYDLTDLDKVDEIKLRLQKTIETISFNKQDENLVQVKSQSTQIFPNIISSLYHIQDSIDEIKALIIKKDNETLQTILQTSLNNAKKEESTEVALMKTILPELIKNPSSMQNFLTLANIMKTKENK